MKINKVNKSRMIISQAKQQPIKNNIIIND